MLQPPKDCPECAKLNGGLCARHIALAVGTETDRECNIEVPDSELGRIGPIQKRYRDEAEKI